MSAGTQDIGREQMHSSTETPALRCRDVTISYDGRRVLDGIDLEVRRNDFVALVGPSGSGKTTLIDIIGGLREPDSGEVDVGGVPIRQPSEHVGYVFQEDSTLPWRSVLRNVELPLELAKVPRTERVRAARAALATVGLDDAADRYPRQLSGGMRQRVAIARLLVTRPEVFLLDEPFGALDEQLRLALGLEMRATIKAAGGTAVLITHSIQEAVLLADRVVVLSRNPARIVLDERVALPSERSFACLTREEAATLQARLWRTLGEVAS